MGAMQEGLRRTWQHPLSRTKHRADAFDAIRPRPHGFGSEAMLCQRPCSVF
jgi:hypothetical protein